MPQIESTIPLVALATNLNSLLTYVEVVGRILTSLASLLFCLPLNAFQNITFGLSV